MAEMKKMGNNEKTLSNLNLYLLGFLHVGILLMSQFFLGMVFLSLVDGTPAELIISFLIYSITTAKIIEYLFINKKLSIKLTIVNIVPFLIFLPELTGSLETNILFMTLYFFPSFLNLVIIKMYGEYPTIRRYKLEESTSEIKPDNWAPSRIISLAFMMPAIIAFFIPILFKEVSREAGGFFFAGITVILIGTWIYDKSSKSQKTDI